MSELDPFDLICKARRGLLCEEEQRRMLAGTLETRLLALVLKGADGDGFARPGDERLVRQIASRITNRRRFRLLRYLRLHTWLAGAAVMLTGAITCARWGAQSPSPRPGPVPPPAMANRAGALRPDARRGVADVARDLREEQTQADAAGAALSAAGREDFVASAGICR